VIIDRLTVSKTVNQLIESPEFENIIVEALASFSWLDNVRNNVILRTILN
jgi:hypothetical protein